MESWNIVCMKINIDLTVLISGHVWVKASVFVFATSYMDCTSKDNLIMTSIHLDQQ